MFALCALFVSVAILWLETPPRLTDFAASHPHSGGEAAGGGGGGGDRGRGEGEGPWGSLKEAMVAGRGHGTGADTLGVTRGVNPDD